MTSKDPVVELDAGFSSPEGSATPWATARRILETAEVFWLSTVRNDGRPHVTPLVAVWLEGSLYFCTGDDEQQAKNLEHNSHCILTTGCNTFREGIDVVVEGDAVVVNDEVELRRLAGLWESKYDWPYEVRDGAFRHKDGEGRVPVFEVPAHKAFAYAKGESGSATRYRFEQTD